MAKGKGGKPRWISPDSDKVERLAATGLTKEQIAHCLGICYNTLNNESKRNLEFMEAIKRGQAKGVSIVANALFENATKKGNTVAQIFFLKCRGKWKEVEDEFITDPMEELKKLAK